MTTRPEPMGNPRTLTSLVWVGLLLSVLVGGLLHAQSTTSVVSGQVLDGDGQPVPGAVVQVASRTLGIVRTEIADAKGRYRVDLLQPGEWVVAARDERGINSKSRTVTLGLQRTLEVDLEIGEGFTEVVSVTAEAPLVDPSRTGGEFRITGAESNALPVSGRVMTDLALLDSSVQPTEAGTYFGERGSVFVINGQTGRANSYLVDGLDNNDQTSGTTTNSFFSQEVIKEFVVMTNQYSAEFGRASGGVMNVVTERGTNEPRFVLFGQGSFRPFNNSGQFVDSLPNPDNQPDTLRRYQVGFTASGPMKKDKSFYFLAYEHQDADDMATYTGVDRNGIPGGWVIAPNRSDSLFLRTDYNLNSHNFMMIRVSADARTSSDVNVAGVWTSEFGSEIDEQDVQLGASLTTIVRGGLMNEVRLLIGTSEFNQSANSSRPGTDRPSGIYGGNALNRQLRSEDRIQILDNVTWQLNHHTLKFGMDLTWSDTLIDAGFNPNGNFLYTTDLAFEPGDGFVFPHQDCMQADGPDIVPCPGIVGVDDDGDGLIDEPAVRETYPMVLSYIQGQPSARLPDTRVAVFAQDHWQASPRWMLDLGLRYDLSTYTLPEEARVDSFIPNGGAQRDTNNLAPRFGFTYRAIDDDRLIVRGGAGMFYDKLVLVFPAVAAVTSATTIGLSFPQGFGQEITEEVVEEYGIPFLIEQNVITFPEPFQLRFSTDTELNTPYAIQANLGLEGKTGQRGVWDAGVVYSRGHNIPLMRDLNPVECFFNDGDPFPPDTCGVPDSEADRLDRKRIPIHRDTSTGSIAAITTQGESWYQAFNVGWRWQGHRTWFSSSYTLSRSEDLGPDPLKAGIYLPPNSDDMSLEKGRSDHDRRHRGVLAGEFPIGAGVRASAVLQLSSGAPFNVTTGDDDNLDGIKSDRPPDVGRNTGESTPLHLINEIRIAKGLPVVDSLNEPSLVQLDLRVWKPFPLGSGGDGQVFIQVFNLFNRVNPAMIEGRATAINFGQPTAQATLPRTVESGVRFAF